MNKYQRASIVLSVLAMSGCSYLYSEDGLIKDTSYEYLKAEQTKELKIPAELNQKNRINYAQVPNIGSKAAAAPVGRELSVGAPVQILAVLENIRLDKTSDHPAVFISDSSDFLWNNIIELFKEYEIQPKRIDKESLTVETGWLAQDKRGIWLGLEAEEEIDDFKVKYTVNITKGDLKDEYRLQTVRTEASTLNEDTEKWEKTPTFWHDSAQMLNLIISRYDKQLAEREQTERNRVIAGFKVELATDADKNAALVTNAAKEDVWTKLPDVLKGLNFKVNDRDRRLMTYFVEYVIEEPGFFASLFSEEAVTLPLEAGNYQISVTEVGERIAITFKDGQGVALESALVSKLYPGLSARFGQKD